MSDEHADLPTVLSRVARLERQLEEIAGVVHAGPGWLSPKYTEPQVIHVLRDLIKPGHTVFDVGANFGHLSLAMSRCAGPRGVVCAFEANPEIVGRCQEALVRGGCGNVQVISAAIYHASRQRLQLYLSDNTAADSVARKVSERSIEVRSLALDDFVEDTGLVPNIVKMGIEGAEFDALSGFIRTVDKHSPILILEQQLDDDRCFRLLRQRGYTALALRSYEPIEEFSNIPKGDILYAQPRDLDGTPYAGPIAKVDEYELGPGAFAWTGEQMHEMLQPFTLGIGRYIIGIDFAADTDVELKCGVAMGSVPIIQYQGPAAFLSQVARDLVVAVDCEGAVSLFFHFPQLRDSSLRVTSVRVKRLPSFDGRTPLFT
jgi:FkbM family methyltransferase